MNWILAIDFGTAFTAAATIDLDAAVRQPRLVEVSGSWRVPSGVLRTADDSLLVGEMADRQAALRMDAYEPTPKRRMGDGSIDLGAPVPVTRLVGAVLGALHDEAVRMHGGTPPSAICLTHPATWAGTRKSSLLAAAASAGMANCVLLPEPVAAASWYVASSGSVPEGGRVAVYDLGGGTFDAAIVQATDTTFETIGRPDGVDPLGGVDIDFALLGVVHRVIAARNPALSEALAHPSTADDRRRARTLLREVRRLKEDLSSLVQADLLVPETTLQVSVTRSELNEVIRAGIERSATVLAGTIASAAMTPDELVAVYLVGGSSRIPLVADIIEERIGIAPTTLDEPKQVVALGAVSWLAAQAVDPASIPAAAEPPPPPFPPRPSAVGVLPPVPPGPLVAPAPSRPFDPAAMLMPPPPPPGPRSADDPRPRPRNKVPVAAAIAVVAVLIAAGVGFAVTRHSSPDTPKQPTPDRLDSLYRSCAGGDLADCDRLYRTADDGSRDQIFASTCGNKSDKKLKGRCAADFDPPADLEALHRSCGSASYADCDALYVKADAGGTEATFAATCGGYFSDDRNAGKCATSISSTSDLSDLHEGCADGDLAQCDQLWKQSGDGNDDETFAITCGGRIADDRIEGGTCVDNRTLTKLFFAHQDFSGCTSFDPIPSTVTIVDAYRCNVGGGLVLELYSFENSDLLAVDSAYWSPDPASEISWADGHYTMTTVTTDAGTDQPGIYWTWDDNSFSAVVFGPDQNAVNQWWESTGQSLSST